MIRSLLFVIFSFILMTASAQQFRKVPQHHFRRGERLEFRISFHSGLTGNIPAAKASLQITTENKLYGGRSTYHAVGYGKTTGIIEAFYSVEERFESFIDEDALLPHYFIRRTRENRYTKNDNVTFRHNDRLAVSLSAVKKIPADIQDMVSAFYYARSLDLTGAKPGREFRIPFFLDDSVYNSLIRYEGIDTIKTRLGKFSCIRVKPGVATGYVFEDPYPVTVWITNDGNRIPVLIESELAVGSVRIELTSYEGLANPVSAKVE
jgi:hypothetical protein